MVGITDPRCPEARVPTYAMRLKGWHPRQVAEALGSENIYVWDGNYYALAVTERTKPMVLTNFGCHIRNE